jgi:hypothetical protein
MNQLPVNTENSINDIAFNKKTISSLPAFFMAHFYMLIKAKMNKNSTDKREIFS